MTFNLGMWPKAVSSFPKLVKAAESCKKNEWNQLFRLFKYSVYG